MCSVYLVHGSFFSPSLDELCIPILNGPFIFLMADCSVMNVILALMKAGKSRPDIKFLTLDLCF